MKNRIEKEFNITIDKKNYKVEFKLTMIGKSFIEVDNKLVSTNVPKIYNLMQEYFFEIDSHKCIIVTNGKKVDMIVDNKSIITQKEYFQLLPVPVWSWIFVCLCLAIPVVSRGGAIPAVLGIMRSNDMC